MPWSVLVACSTRSAEPGPPAPPASAQVSAAGLGPQASVSHAAPGNSAGASPAAPPPSAPAVSFGRALEVTFGDKPPEGCSKGDVRCLVARRFAKHDEERKDALALFDETGDVVGTEREHQMEGGFRGTIQIVPELPVGPHKRHLAWILAAQRDIASFLRQVEERSGKPVSYRHRALVFRFFRSVGRTTPSAYAASWEIGHNVSGSLHGSKEAVRETLFHEVFHLNDQAHNDWSRRTIGPIVDGIADRCARKTACLAPYAPFKTMVRGGTFYAFQANNGDIAHEYSAELATRYFLEQRAAMAGTVYPGGWFKCGPKENALVMTALAKEFFAGFDATPPCASGPV